MFGQIPLIILYYCFSKNQIAPQEHPVGRRFALVCRSLHPPVDLTCLRTLVVPAPEDTLELGVALQRPDADGRRFILNITMQELSKSKTSHTE